MEVRLRIHTLEGTRDVQVSTSRLTLGRTPEADVVINDTGLSRVHASINRDGSRVWIIDEGSTNGTYINRNPVPPTGAALSDGDEIDLGQTTIVVNFLQITAVNYPPGSIGASPLLPVSNTSGVPPAVIAAGAGVLIVLLAAIVIGLASRSYNSGSQITVKKNVVPNTVDPNPTVAPTTQNSPEPGTTPVVNSVEPGGTDLTVPGNTNVTPTKPYLAMSQEEQRQFVATASQHVARMIGNREGYAFTPEVVTKIKIWVDAYARRLRSPKPTGGCNMRHDLATLLTRARSHAPAVVKAFNEKGLSPQVGLYLAMIEAEYCPCLSSGTGPKGYFQFACSTAKRYGVQDVSSPKDTRFDDRCKIDIMAPIAAQYMKDLIAMFGTGPLSVPLAIASYNEGEGGLSANLMKALNAARTSENPERSFWTMVANSDMMSDQFQREAIKYVPHFFGAAIVGENPRVFGVDMGPISTYTQPERNSADAQKTSD
jgi:hypothetical protein